jgi:polyferredoxin
VILGADPAPMGTVKDAIALFGARKVIFPPRLIALTVFLLMVLIANKAICAWGCQVGTLQDFLFRINRDKNDKPVIRQIKLPFLFTNSVRIVFLSIFTSAAFIWAFDIVEPIDPFKVFKPAKLTGIGWTFIGLLCIASIFIYRPWCHMFCPFGLVGWLVEKVAFFKVRVDYKMCIGCEICVNACPSTVMNSILKRDKVIADCFSCGSCIEVCPAKAITFSAGKRILPPPGKFSDKR